LSNDIYDNEQWLISIDRISNELLYHLAEKSDTDEVMESLKTSLEFAVNMITKEETQLLFFRFLQGNSFKTLKKTVMVGSTKTAAKRTRKLINALKAYTKYDSGNDYEKDLDFIQEKLGKDARTVADMLFRRMSKNAIQHSSKIIISQSRLKRTMLDIEVVCLDNIRLDGFWNVLNTVGKINRKKSKNNY